MKKSSKSEKGAREETWEVAMVGQKQTGFSIANAPADPIFDACRTTRTTKISLDDEALHVEVTMSYGPTNPDGKVDASRAYVSVSMVMSFRLRKKTGTKMVELNASNASNMPVPSALYVNLIYLTHSVARGAVTMLTRGSWLNDFVPQPTHVHDVLPPEIRDVTSSNEFNRWIL